MNGRLLSPVFFLGILSAFVAWAVQWAFDAWKEVTFDVPGEVTVLRLSKGPQEILPVEAASAQEELKAYLRDHFLALTVSSSGDGRPEILVYDPHGLIPWFPGCPSDEVQFVPVYLFRDTYSEDLWERSATNPFLPQGAVVQRIIVAPRRAGTLQYARCMGQDLLPEGQYTFNTIDPAQVQHILDLAYRMGLVSQGGRKLLFSLYLLQDPLMVMTAFFVIAGYGCVVLYWLLYLHGRLRELGIRGRCGALPGDLVRENFFGGLPSLVTGSVLGGGSADILVAAMSQVHLFSRDWLLLGITTVVTAIMAALTWLVVLVVVIRSRYEVSLAW